MKKKCKFIKGLEEYLKSRYSEDLVERVLTNAAERYEKLLEENADEPKVMWIHTRERIYPAIAAFYGMLGEGFGRDDARELLAGFYAARSGKVAKKMKRTMKIPGLYKWIPRLFAKMTNKAFGESAGFQSVMRIQTKDIVKFDMVVCPYFDLCTKYGCPELTAMYCRADDICYGSMHPKIAWLRTKTLGLGGDCCDFDVRIVKSQRRRSADSHGGADRIGR